MFDVKTRLYHKPRKSGPLLLISPVEDTSGIVLVRCSGYLFE